MPKIVTKGVGLMQRKVVVYSLEDDPEAFRPDGALHQWFSKKRQTADECRDANANHWRNELTKVYAKMDPARFCRNSPDQTESVRSAMARHPQGFVAGYFGENHAYAIMQEWLNWYDRLAAERAKPDPNIPLVVEIAEELGRLRELFRWRAGVDPDTGERREAMALREKKAISDRRKGGKTNADEAAKRKAIAHHLAGAIVAKRTKPIKGRPLAAAVLAAWPEDNDERPKFGTVRNYLSDFAAKV